MQMEVDTRPLAQLARALAAEADGRHLRKELAAGLRKAFEPARDEARAAVLSMPSSLGSAGSEPLRQSIARQVKVEAVLTGRTTGARVKVTRRGMPRGFANAARRTQAAGGWRHKVYGRDVWVTQRGKAGWFDDAMRRHHDDAAAAALEAMESAARRIARRAR